MYFPSKGVEVRLTWVVNAMAGNAVVTLRSLKAEAASVELTKNSKGPQTGEHIARQNHDSDGVEMDTSVIRLSVVGEWSDEAFYTCQWTVGSVQSSSRHIFHASQKDLDNQNET